MCIGFGKATLVNAWREVHSTDSVSQQWTTLHDDFNYQLDIFVLLDLLDRVQAGVFRAVILVPPASTWSRARHFGRRNYSTLVEFTDQVLEVMEDQAKRGQVLKLSEDEARARFPNLVVASLGAQRKEKPGGVVTSRVLFDFTHGIDVNTSTRIRDQERAPIAADLKRAMREKSQVEEKTFALTADVSEHLLGCQVRGGSSVYVNTVGTFGVASASYYWSRTAAALGRLSQYFGGHAALHGRG